MSDSSKELVERVYSFLEKADLFVWDFSILMTMDNIELINWLAHMAIKNKKQVFVSEEFYRCYSIVVKSSSAEQREIAQNTKALLTLMKNNSVLVSNSKYRTTASIVKALHMNPKVAFLCASNSEAAELLVSSDSTQAMILAITQEGKLCCCNRNKLSELIDTEVNSDKRNKYVLPIEKMPEIGSTLKTDDDRYFVLTDEISSGAEGTVYSTNDNRYVCKVFHEKQLSVLRCKKLKFFENRQVRYDGICWPEKIVYTSDGKPVGYIMQRAYGREMSKVFDGEESILEYFPHWKRIDLIELSIKILEKFIYLHLLGIKVGDIRPQNIVIGNDGSVYLIDMDSCQIEDYPCPFGDEDFTPAENQGKTFDSFLRTYRNERFSIYVLVFTILFLGAHPYAQKNGADTIAEEIHDHSFPYPHNCTEKCPKAPVGGYDRIWNITPQSICTLFYNCFKRDERADIVELLMLLDSYKTVLKTKYQPNSPEMVLGFDDSYDDFEAQQNTNARYINNVTSVSQGYSSSGTGYSPVNSGQYVNNNAYNGYNSSSSVYNGQINQSYNTNVYNNTTPGNQNAKDKSSGSRVFLWVIILLCIFILTIFLIVSAYNEGEISLAVKPIIENFCSLNLGG